MVDDNGISNSMVKVVMPVVMMVGTAMERGEDGAVESLERRV